MKYKYIYILESVRCFYIKGWWGGLRELKELGYIMRQNTTKIKNQYEKLSRTKQKSDNDSANFCFVIIIVMLRSSTYLLANVSTHATVCTSLILQASRGAGISCLLLRKGGIMQIILSLRQCMLGD